MRSLLKAALLALLFVAPRTARATNYTTKICFVYELDWWSPGLAAGDRWTTSANRPARGIWAKLVDHPSGGVNNVVVDTYTAWDGSDPGCFTWTFVSGHHYDLYIKRKALVNGVSINAWTGTDEATATLPLVQFENNYAPANATTRTYGLASELYVPYLMTASGLMALDNFGLDGVKAEGGNSLEFYPQVDENGYLDAVDGGVYDGDPTDCNCWVAVDYGIVPMPDGHLHDQATLQKYLVAHEIGHMIAILRDAGYDVSDHLRQTVDSECGYTQKDISTHLIDLPDEDGCRADENGAEDKGMISMEYQAMAAREGWADFVSEYMFNLTSESDCVEGAWDYQDFDLDDDDVLLGSPASIWQANADNYFGSHSSWTASDFHGWYSCDGVPITTSLCTTWGVTPNPDDVVPSMGAGTHVPLETYVHAKDWLQGVYSNGACGLGTVSLTNRSTAYDWARFWWDMATGQAVPISDLTDLFDNMDLRDADPDDNSDPDHDCGLTSTDDDVTVLLLDSAAATPCYPDTDCVSQVDAEKDNGQNH